MGVFTYVGLTIIGLDLALTLSILAGLLEVIPVLGPVLAAIPMLIIALLESPTQALVVLLFVLALQQVESRILLPFIMRSQTEVSPLLVLVAIFVGEALGGLLGAIVAIPLVSMLRVFVQRVVAPWARRRTGAPSLEEMPSEEDVGEADDGDTET